MSRLNNLHVANLSLLYWFGLILSTARIPKERGVGDIFVNNESNDNIRDYPKNRTVIITSDFPQVPRPCQGDCASANHNVRLS